MDLYSARVLAIELSDYIASGCERREIAGSIRREKQDPSDIELIVIPKMRDDYIPADMFSFGPRQVSCLDDSLHDLFDAGEWCFDPIVKRNGPKYKRLSWRHLLPNGPCADLFIVTAETWGAQFVIRTGPLDFSKAMVSRALRLGMKQDDGNLWKIHRDGSRTIIPTPNEIDFFNALEVPYLEPKERSAERLGGMTLRWLPQQSS